jgi:hypothetical protein
LEKTIIIPSIILIVFVLLSGMAAADRLPNQTPENQVFTTVSSVEAIGSYSGSQDLQWTAGYDPVTTRMSVMHVYASATPASMSTDNYEKLHGVLVNGGGSDNSAKPDELWRITSMTIPESLLGTVIDLIDGEKTFHTLGDYASFYYSHRPDPRFVGSHTVFDVPSMTGHGGLHTGILDPDEVRATTAYSEMSETNGGYISETKTFDPDTRNKAVGLFNVESTKTFTYATDANTGSIAQTSEMIATDNMGSPTITADVIACPFGPSQSEILPAFCNVVYAKSMSQGVTSAAQSSSAQVRMVAASADTPAELNYNFDVKPDASAGVGYAMGTFGTEFGVSIKEARGNNLTPSATVVYTDKATVAGMVAKFTKQYQSKSGFSL